MSQEYLSIENAKKIANYDKLIAENTMLKSDNYILKNKSIKGDETGNYTVKEVTDGVYTLEKRV